MKDCKTRDHCYTHNHLITREDGVNVVSISFCYQATTIFLLLLIKLLESASYVWNEN